MKKAIAGIAFVACAYIAAGAFASSADAIAQYEAVAGLPRDPNEKTVEPPKGMKIFLLMGQSNMAGRAKPLDADRIPAPNAYKMNRDDKWSPATPPLHYDKKVAGYGPADAFIRAYLAEHPGEAIGVIPCAVGGSSIKMWGNGANHLEVAVRRLKAALPYGEIAGVLWHQGETDALKMDEARYKELFAQMAARVRKEVGRDVPIVVGEIGRFMEVESDRINPIIVQCAAETPKCACVSSKGLKNQDRFHFDRASAEELGRRYYAAWKELSGRKDDSRLARSREDFGWDSPRRELYFAEILPRPMKISAKMGRPRETAGVQAFCDLRRRDMAAWRGAAASGGGGDGGRGEGNDGDRAPARSSGHEAGSGRENIRCPRK